MATVAEQWYQVAESANSQIIQLTRQLETLEDQIRLGQGNRFALTGQRAAIIQQIQELEKTESDAKQNGFKALEAEKSGATIEPPAGASPNANSTGDNTAVVVTPATAPSNDQITVSDTSDPGTNRDFVYDPVTGELVPGDSESAGEILNSPPLVPNADGAAEGGNTAADAAALANNGTQDNGDGAAEGGNTVGNIQPAAPPNPPSLPAPKDWRVRISLAPGAKYFYGDDSNKLLAPLRATDGVIFPYTPTISVSYNAKYDTQSLTHSNYAAHTYAGSSVDGVSITAEFTAQDVNEANYMLAVIHFFRSATKMFYGQDSQRIGHARYHGGNPCRYYLLDQHGWRGYHGHNSGDYLDHCWDRGRV
jgi:hypothetical protein